jgi:putative hydrolase of the HAD superfamily
MKSTYKAIFFDLFGTLISVSKAAGDKDPYTADILGLDRAEWSQVCFSEHHDILGETDHLDTVTRLAHCLDPAIPMHKIQQAVETRQRRFDLALIQVEPDILGALHTLNEEGFGLGLISNASTGEIRAWPNSPLAPLFETVHFSCQRGVKKPQPEIYDMALAEMGISRGDALFVGDGSSYEHLGANACGIDSLLVTYFLNMQNRRELQHRGRGSKGMISHIRDLRSLLAGDDISQ